MSFKSLNLNLITSVIKKIDDDAKKLVIDLSILDRLKGTHVAIYSVESKNKIEIQQIDGFDPDTERVVTILLEMTKNEPKLIMYVLTSLFQDNEIFTVLWQAGTCDIKTERYEGCVWQGLLRVPIAYTDQQIEEKIMKTNIELKTKMILGAVVNNVCMIGNDEY